MMVMQLLLIELCRRLAVIPCIATMHDKKGGCGKRHIWKVDEQKHSRYMRVRRSLAAWNDDFMS